MLYVKSLTTEGIISNGIVQIVYITVCDAQNSNSRIVITVYPKYHIFASELTSPEKLAS
jgi:hypothetical protein